jgi:hypothetical protein
MILTMVLSDTNMVCDEVCNNRGLIRTIAIIDGGNLEKIKKTTCMFIIPVSKDNSVLGTCMVIFKFWNYLYGICINKDKNQKIPHCQNSSNIRSQNRRSEVQIVVCPGRHRDLINLYGISVTTDHGYVPLVALTIRPFHRSLHIARFLTRITERVQIVFPDR